MSDHTQVYGICENLCKVPIYSKDQVDELIGEPVTVVDNLTSTSTTDALSARMGKEIGDGLVKTVGDTTVSISKVVPSGVKVKSARLKRLHDSTIVHNQLVKNGNFVGTTNWSSTGSTISASDNVLTITPTNQYGYLSQEATLVSGHKYLLRVDTKRASGSYRAGLGHNNTFSREGVYATLTSDNSWHTSAIIGTYTSDSEGTGATWIFIGNRSEDFSPISVRRVKVVDLTKQYGSGNEPSTVDEYIARGGNLDVEDYDSGTLTDCKPEGVKVVGRNLIDLNRFEGSTSATTHVVDGDEIRITSAAAYGRSVMKINGNELNALIGKTLRMSCEVSQSVESAIYRVGFVVYYTDDTSTTYANVNSSGITSAILIGTNAREIQVSFMANNTASDLPTPNVLTIRNPIMEITSDVPTYSPYQDSTLALPTALTSLDGFGRKGTIIDFEKKTMTVTYGKRAYQSGDEDDATVITDGTNTVYPLDEAVATDITSQLATFSPYLEDIEPNGLIRLIFGTNRAMETRWDVSYDSVYDALASHSEEIKALKARETQPTITVIDNLTSTSSTDALSAKQGKALKDLVDTKASTAEVNSLVGGLTKVYIQSTAPSDTNGVWIQ